MKKFITSILLIFTVFLIIKTPVFAQTPSLSIIGPNFNPEVTSFSFGFSVTGLPENNPQLYGITVKKLTASGAQGPTVYGPVYNSPPVTNGSYTSSSNLVTVPVAPGTPGYWISIRWYQDNDYNGPVSPWFASNYETPEPTVTNPPPTQTGLVDISDGQIDMSAEEIGLTLVGTNLPISNSGNYTVKIYAGPNTSSPLEATLTGSAQTNGSGSWGPQTITNPVNTSIAQHHVTLDWFAAGQTTSSAQDELLVTGVSQNATGNIDVLGPGNNPPGIHFTFTGENFTPGSNTLLVEYYTTDNSLAGAPSHTNNMVVGVEPNGEIFESFSWDPTDSGTYVVKIYSGSDPTPENLIDEAGFHFDGEDDETVNITTTPQDLSGCDLPGVYCLLEPLGNGGGILDRVNVGSGFGEYLDTIFQIGVAMAGIFGILMIVVGGFTYMTTDSYSKKNDGKDQIKNALMGFVLALVSWLLLYTLNPNLTSFDIGINTVGTGSSSSHPWNNGAAAAGTNICPNQQVLVGGTPTEITMGGVWPSDTAQRGQLTGVTVNNGTCDTAGANSCTSLLNQGSSTDKPGKINAFKVACDS